MSLAKWKGRFLRLHRWIALAITPLLLVVVLSGAVLSFRPILGARAAPKSDGKVDAAALAAALPVIDPEGQAKNLLLSEDGKTVELRGGKAKLGTFDIATRSPVAPAGRLDVFDLAVKAHRGLFVGVHQLSDISTYALVAVLLLGPLIAWPRRRNTLMGWHVGAGWLLYPILALGPVTAVLLALHIGGGPRGGGKPESGNPRERGAAAAPDASIPQAIDLAREKGLDLTTLRAVAKQGRGNVLFTVATAGGLTYHAASTATHTIQRVEPAPSLVKKLHEGTWAGALSGGVSLLGTALLTGLLASGTYSWGRRAAGRRRRAPR